MKKKIIDITNKIYKTQKACPHCGKTFVRLDKHLPHCKVKDTTKDQVILDNINNNQEFEPIEPDIFICEKCNSKIIGKSAIHIHKLNCLNNPNSKTRTYDENHAIKSGENSVKNKQLYSTMKGKTNFLKVVPKFHKTRFVFYSTPPEIEKEL